MHVPSQLIAGFVGLVGTLIGLRIWQRGRSSQLRSEFSEGAITWGALVRERNDDGRWGVAGVLKLTKCNELRFDPTPSDLRRGWRPSTWQTQKAHIHFGRRRLDISGMRLTMLELTDDDQTVSYGAFRMVGHLPDEWTR